MDRGDFLKAFGGLITIPLLITDLVASTPTDNVVKLGLNETITTDTFDFVDYIIKHSSGKINGHQLYKAPSPAFLIYPDGTPYVSEVPLVNARPDMRVIKTMRFRTYLDGDFLHKHGGYTSRGVEVPESFINVMRENVRERRILADKLIKELEEMINKPTYLYTISVTPIIDDITYKVAFYGMMIRMI